MCLANYIYSSDLTLAEMLHAASGEAGESCKMLSCMQIKCCSDDVMWSIVFLCVPGDHISETYISLKYTLSQ